MTKTLILVRHGKAKTLVEGQQDFERELTEAGKRSLDASLIDELKQLDSDCGTVQVWSSPAIRAMQTAKAVVRALKQKDVKPQGGILEHEELWSQSENDFMSEVERSEADTIFAIGHNPFIELVAEHLTGARVPFATGAMCAICVDFDSLEVLADASVPPTHDACRLLWFTQGPISQRWKTLVTIEKVFRSGIETTISRRQAFFDNPDDIETMHKFRVSIRTLRSLVAFAKPWQDAKQNASMQADLKEVVGLTSRLRELDVFCEQAKSASSNSPALIAFCEEEAARERAQVLEALADSRVTKRLERVLDNSKHVRWKKQYVKNGLDARIARERFDDLTGELEHDLSVLDLSEVEPTHDVRKSAKRVRYVAENFTDIVGEDAPAIAKGMTAHQDNLGAICDARVNIDLINGFADRELPEEVAWDLALLRAQNETFLYTSLKESR